MKTKSPLTRYANLIITLIVVLSFFSALLPQDIFAASPMGAWVDHLLFSVVDPADAVVAIEKDEIDVYASGLWEDYETDKVDPLIEVETSNSLYYDLSFNPSGPVFSGTLTLNPFSVPAIREAMNLLIDRNYIIQNITGPIARAKYLPISIGFPDFTRYNSKVSLIESQYAYDYVSAETTITIEMEALGAIYNMSEELWYYNGKPVEIIFIIRNDGDGLRIGIGDYIADQLESLGFVVDRQFKTSSQAVPIWLMGYPADGEWHLYTGGWTNSIMDRDEGELFKEFYSPAGAYGFTPLWSAYTPVPEFDTLMDALAANTFADMGARDIAFERAMELAMEDSVRMWIAERRVYFPRSPLTTAAYDYAEGMARLFPYTTQFLSGSGGDMRVGQDGLFANAWNPVASQVWVDRVPMQATADDALLPNPTNGLMMLQRIAGATVTAQTGLPVYNTMGWVSLSFSPVIDVPANAWADWNAISQEFILAGDMYPGGTTALIKSVVVYPTDLFTTVKWHDGSSLSVADFVYGMILSIDRTKFNSLLYDSTAPGWPADLVAIRIINDAPLTIETYTNAFNLDAELNVYTWWPKGISGPQPWHVTSLAAVLEEKDVEAFSPDKASADGVPQINYLTDPTIIEMAALIGSGPFSYVPYFPTMSLYVTPGEDATRWSNLQTWFAAKGHFWVGDGPFYLDAYSWGGQTLVLTRFDDFPDMAGKWDAFCAIAYHYFAYLPLTLK
ncbi:MAG: ABC transporter substrate-binding protein [Anaerolineaceae bacterium]|nr:ABC transporter substrate-binding protein [Anaerolineaceae bacterium]